MASLLVYVVVAVVAFVIGMILACIFASFSDGCGRGTCCSSAVDKRHRRRRRRQRDDHDELTQQKSDTLRTWFETVVKEVVDRGIRYLPPWFHTRFCSSRLRFARLNVPYIFVVYSP